MWLLQSKFKFFLLLVLAFILALWFSPFAEGWSKPVLMLAWPVWALEDAFGRRFVRWANYFEDKQRLTLENEQLKQSLARWQARGLLSSRLAAENEQLRRLAGAVSGVEAEAVVARIISNPWRGPFDSFVIDLGADNSHRPVAAHDLVVFSNSILLGEVIVSASNTAKVKLISAAGSELPVVIGDERVAALARGQGDGNFRVSLPRDVALAVGQTVFSERGPHNWLIGQIGAIDSDLTDTFQTIYVRSPLNLNQIEWVEIYAQ